ncbi:MULTISPECIES: LysR family transcriptional regulator [Bacillus]|uniref:LysR family transcriptional regulator n=1 Tax=Bacillus glycinifermentans TaxID=1664069 RepID=A0AAJ4D138_9BACI|nr:MULTISPECIES: LysR family transcriptional regulator [Bacillus]KKB73637.1 LysR family transcriptional regulator [Bacillus sp. TH008]MDU0072223.1 LysR family transcriptional regulator [Bacillus sp. IG6]MED8019848.1 LysR family transcriptional regulator [Bacillus glycinifermentans]QAT63899.1 LysR family transcriptional regulator [Bacillus glycinifermentans]WKB77775.1 LysR family transcriptional regulator [Bacillus glycinifermentans]
MDIRQLKYFVTIAEEGKITAAAKQLHIAQPPLSRQLKQLEEELGVVLFDRNKKKSLTLTYEGEVFYKRAKDILHKLRDSILEVQELREEVAGTLAVGSTIYCAALLLSKVSQIREKYPSLLFNIWEGEPSRLHKLLENRQIDAAITTTPFYSKNVESKSLPDIPCKLVLPGNQSYGLSGKADMKEISKLPLILLRPSDGKGIYDKVVEAFQKSGAEPKVVCECHDSTTLLSLVTSGFGATILPLSMLPEHFARHVQTLEIKDNPFILTPSVVWRANSFLPKPVKEFLALF